MIGSIRHRGLKSWQIRVYAGGTACLMGTADERRPGDFLVAARGHN
jgi:hypothetical protein